MFFTFAAAIGGLAQLVRALAWHARGREFESRILHHFLRVIVVFSGGYFHFNGIRFYALVKPTVLPFRRPERRSTAADVRPRTPRDPRSFSANRSSAQPTYNCRPHPLHLHLRLRIETADNLQRGAESPRSESYPKHVRSHDLPRPLPTLRAPQTTPSPDRIPPGSTALPQTVRGRSATIPPPALATFPDRLLSPVSRTVPTSDSDAKRIPPLPPKTGSLPPHGVFPLPPQTAAPRRCCATPASAYAFAGQPTDGTRQGAQRPSLLSSSLPTKSAENPGISRPDPRICLRNRPEIGRTNGRRSENVPPRRHGQQRSSRRPFSGARHLPGNPIGPPPKRRISPEPPLSGRRTGRAQSQNLRGVFRQPFETVPKPIRIRPLRHRPKNLFPEPDTEPPTLEKHPPVPVLKPSTRAASQDSPRAGPEKPPEEPVPRAEHSPPKKAPRHRPQNRQNRSGTNRSNTLRASKQNAFRQKGMRKKKCAKQKGIPQKGRQLHKTQVSGRRFAGRKHPRTPLPVRAAEVKRR